MLSSLFPLLRTLDCSHMATPSKQKLRTIVKLPNLTGLCIEGNDDTGNGVLEVVVKARQLTQLTLDSAQVLCKSKIYLPCDCNWAADIVICFPEYWIVIRLIIKTVPV